MQSSFVKAAGLFKWTMMENASVMIAFIGMERSDMHHNSIFYSDERCVALLKEGPRHVNVFVLEGFREPDRHIFGVASLRRQENEKFWKQKPSYRIVVRKK